MKKIKFASFALIATLIVSSCQTSQQTGTAIGAGGGAAVGALLGRLIGGNAQGTAIGAAIGAGAGAVAGNLIGKKMDKKKAELQAQLQKANTVAVTDANGLPALKVTFDSGILFATSKADLNATAQAELTKLANSLRGDNNYYIAVQGHTDSTGSDAINNPLSVSRAENVAKHLLANGITNAQLKAVEGYGSSQPVADNSTEAGRKQNRRVDIYLYASDTMIQAAKAGTLQ